MKLKFFNSFVDKGLLERLNHVMTSEFARVSYTEAVKTPLRKRPGLQVPGLLGL